MKKNKKNLFEKETFTHNKSCNKNNCTNPGIYKAPKSKKELNNYIWFCEQHIKEYNKDWNYCKDMSQSEIEKHIQLDTIGWRPTWNFSTSNFKLRSFEKVFNNYFNFFKKNKKKDFKQNKNRKIEKALKIFNLNKNKLTINIINEKYKKLVKKYHPDKNKGNIKYEEKLKEINQAFEEIKKIFN